jgi:hypothetical protein
MSLRFAVTEYSFDTSCLRVNKRTGVGEAEFGLRRHVL